LRRRAEGRGWYFSGGDYFQQNRRNTDLLVLCLLVRDL